MLNKFILGTAQLGEHYGINNRTGPLTNEQAHILLETAWNLGIEMLDTAPAYGKALSRIGEFHRAKTKQFRVVSKYKKSEPGEALSRNSIEQQLRTLDLDRLSVLQLHCFDDYRNSPHILEEAFALKNQGLVEKIGASIYTNSEFEEALAAGFEVIQLPYNALDNLYFRETVITKARINKIELHSRSVFLQGLFFKDSDNIPFHLQPLTKYVKILKDIATRYSVSLLELLLLYVFQNDNIDRVIIGVDEPIQLQNNVAALKQRRLPSACVAEIDSLIVAEPELLDCSRWSKPETD